MADGVQRATVAGRATTVRRSAKVGPRPFAFVLYTAEVHQVVESHGLTVHYRLTAVKSTQPRQST